MFGTKYLFADFWSSLSLGQQLHREAKLSLFFLLLGHTQYTYGIDFCSLFNICSNKQRSPYRDYYDYIVSFIALIVSVYCLFVLAGEEFIETTDLRLYWAFSFRKYDLQIGLCCHCFEYFLKKDLLWIWERFSTLV